MVFCHFLVKLCGYYPNHRVTPLVPRAEALILLKLDRIYRGFTIVSGGARCDISANIPSELAYVRIGSSFRRLNRPPLQALGSKANSTKSLTYQKGVWVEVCM